MIFSRKKIIYHPPKKKKKYKRKVTIPFKIVPVSGITPRPSSNSNPWHLQIRATQLHLLLHHCIKSSRTLWSNSSYSVNSWITHHSKTTTAYVKSHGASKTSSNPTTGMWVWNYKKVQIVIEVQKDTIFNTRFQEIWYKSEN